ncbi:MULTISPECIES: hypothetical protein [unclassified Gordonia (in: high G+C Gram-positive bacteria)]|uniref:hypothetical protein n=2 Tax=Gordonia TaxID=2053 RepID=UPI000991043B|nr:MULTISPECIES: hypothetical protein [unclassified Gordonia (in: high G+C Gram-positive bacteria)]MBR7192741.1 hypothetical protein [Gordonia sp. SCSIO 19800]MCX2753526.1 hypothetical protein [Gordonia sp. 4N]
MTDRNDPDRTDPDMNPTDEKADSTSPESGAVAADHTDGATSAEDTNDAGTAATPRGKSARRSGTGTVASTSQTDGADASGAAGDPLPAASSKAGSDRREISFTVTGGGIKKVLAAIVAVALIALVAFFGWRAYDLQREADAFADSKAASADFVTKLVTTLNADNAGNSKELLGPLSTGELRNRLEQERADTEANVESLNIEVSSTISVVAVETVDADTAKTVVMAEVTGRSVKLPSGGTSLMVFRLDLSKEDGKWLVSEVDGPPGSPSGQIDPSQSLPGAAGAPAPQPSPAPQPAPGG